jgi:iron complex transport system substrate-binding protein
LKRAATRSRLRRRTLLGAVALLLGCERSPKGEARTTTTSAPAARERVVSLSPSTTETMFAIGAGTLLVGRSQHCDFPPEASALPSVGGFANPSMESIIALRPTVVVGSRSPAGPALADQLRDNDIEALFPPTDDVAQVIAMIETLSKRFDAKGGGALIARIEARLEAIRAWRRGRPRLSVVMVFDAAPLFVAGPGGFVDELIRLAGGRNVIVSGGAWPTIDAERLLTLDPDVVIDAVNVGHGDELQLGEAPGWQALRAKKEGRIRRLRSASALRPGPRIADGVAEVARAIHDEVPP